MALGTTLESRCLSRRSKRSPIFKFCATYLTYRAAACRRRFPIAFLNWTFPKDDLSRIEVLNDKANEGTLADDETVELEPYTNIADRLAYWQSLGGWESDLERRQIRRICLS